MNKIHALSVAFSLGLAFTAPGALPKDGPLSANGVFQWSCEVKDVVSRETKAPPRAYLWIPEKCAQLKAVVIANDNMLEETLLTRGDFRARLAAADTGIVFVSNGLQGLNKGVDDAGWRVVEEMLATLADESGYGELVKGIRLVPLGHSAWSDWPYFMAHLRPDRIACAVSFKGAWPQAKPWFGDDYARSLKGVPLFVIGGEYEGGRNNVETFPKRLAEWRSRGIDLDFRFACDWLSGHFDYTDAAADFAGRYIAACVTGKPHDEKALPWLPAPALKKVPIIGYVDENKVINQDPKYHLQVTVPYRPEPPSAAFEIVNVCDQIVSAGRTEGWTGLKAGERAYIPDHPKPIAAKVIQGPGLALGNNRFDVRFNRHGFYGYRAREIVLAAIYPGDEKFQQAVQQAMLRIPLRAKEGKVARPTGWFVREGPAVVDEKGAVTWYKLPPKAKRPAQATLVAYAYDPKTGNLTWQQTTIHDM